MTNPASVRFFDNATRALKRQHGARSGSPTQYELLRTYIAAAEKQWLEMQPAKGKQ